jgi:hypothetical protein
VIAILSAVLPFVSDPAYKLLYNNTLDTFPGAMFILTGSIYLVISLIYVFIHGQRHRLLVNRKGEVINEVTEVLKAEELITSKQDRRGSYLVAESLDERQLDALQHGDIFVLSKGMSIIDEERPNENTTHF